MKQIMRIEEHIVIIQCYVTVCIKEETSRKKAEAIIEAYKCTYVREIIKM
jgi:hypothetical protein